MLKRARACRNCGRDLVFSRTLKTWVHDEPGAWIGCSAASGKAKPEPVTV